MLQMRFSSRRVVWFGAIVRQVAHAVVGSVSNIRRLLPWIDNVSMHKVSWVGGMDACGSLSRFVGRSCS